MTAGLASLPATAAPQPARPGPTAPSASALAPAKAPAPQGWLGVSLGSDAVSRGEDPAAPDDDTPIEGVGVLGVVADGPARRAGLRARDVILSVDGVPVTSGSQLVNLIRSHAPDGWITLSIRRGARTMDLRAFLEARPENPGSMRILEGWIGVEAIDLTSDLREHFGAPRDAGVMISRVVAGSPAESAGLSVGDVVFEVDGDPIRSRRGLAIAIAGGGVDNRPEVRLMRDGARITVEPLITPRPEKIPDSDGD